MQKLKSPYTNKKHLKKLQILEEYINEEDSGLKPDWLPKKNSGKDISRNLANSSILQKIRKCTNCNKTPLLTISFHERGVAKKQGCCSDHWEQLSETNLGWT